MRLKSKTSSLLVLGITAVVCSRTMLLAFDDPEGPNLLIVAGMAAVIYIVSLSAYLFGSSDATFKRLSLAILIQVVLATGLYFLLR